MTAKEIVKNLQYLKDAYRYFTSRVFIKEMKIINADNKEHAYVSVIFTLRHDRRYRTEVIFYPETYFDKELANKIFRTFKNGWSISVMDLDWEELGFKEYIGGNRIKK